MHVWALTAKHVALEYEIIDMHNGSLKLRHHQGHRLCSREHVFVSLEKLVEDIVTFAHPL